MTSLSKGLVRILVSIGILVIVKARLAVDLRLAFKKILIQREIYAVLIFRLGAIPGERAIGRVLSQVNGYRDAQAVKATAVAEAGFALAFIVNPVRLLVLRLGIFTSLREVELSLLHVFIVVGAVPESIIPRRQS